MHALKKTNAEMVVGIDPGVNTGIAWMRVHPMQIESVDTKGFWETYDMMRDIADRDPTATTTIVVVVEDGGANSPVFHTANNRAAQNMTAKRVGGNHKDSDRLAEGIERLGYNVIRVKPSHTKKNAAYVEKMTGFTGKTNAHNRDAITMIWGRNW